MKTLNDLLEKLDNANKGSRELDGDIWWMMLSEDHRRIYDSTGYVQETIDRDSSKSISGGDGWPGKGLGRFYDSARKPPSMLDYAPAITTNLTEALRYIPEGWILEHLGDDAGGYPGKMERIGATAEISDGFHTAFRGQGATRELAVIIACLKQRIWELSNA